MTDIMETCRHEGCGGCLYQGMPYEEQLKLKDAEIRRLLAEREINCGEYLGIQRSPCITAYRNKMDYTFGDEEKGGPITLGMHRRRRFMSVLTTDHCLLVDPDFNRILSAVLRLVREKGWPFYHKKSHQGLLRNLVLRRGERTGELLINLVTTSQADFDEQAFVDLIRTLPLTGRVVGILRTICDGIADFVYCDRLDVLWGRDYYEEKLLGLTFRVSAFSFFQTNVEAVEGLYEYALTLTPDLHGKTVCDLYCGTGTITQALALKAEVAIGIELAEEAVAAARAAAQENGLFNCMFLAGDVLNMLDQVEKQPDLIVLDPPRAGIHPKALKKILARQVPEIIYISCNPKTMTENLQAMQADGYRTVSLKAFDNFPFTGHTEAVALLQRRFY